MFFIRKSLTKRIGEKRLFHEGERIQTLQESLGSIKDIKIRNIENYFFKKYQKKNVNKTNKEVVDICTIIKKCSIDEISKYILMQDKKKGFPDITIRE